MTYPNSDQEALEIFLRFGKPYIDLMAKDNKGRVALTAFIDTVENGLGSFNKADITSKISTLLRHGASPDLQGSSYFHQLSIRNLPFKDDEDLSACFCILIKGGADIHAVDDRRDMSVTEALHSFRHGHLWEQALELCGFKVDEVYAIDHNRGSEISDDIYTPTNQRPRVRGPMDIPAYNDKCRKGLQGCAAIHRRHTTMETCTEGHQIRRWKWTGKCRWPNSMIHELHGSCDEASDDNSSEIEEDRVSIASDCGDHGSNTEDDYDEEMCGVPI